MLRYNKLLKTVAAETDLKNSEAMRSSNACFFLEKVKAHITGGHFKNHLNKSFHSK
jgi:hypothetical protein